MSIDWIYDDRCNKHIGGEYERKERTIKISEKLGEIQRGIKNERLAKAEEIQLAHDIKYINKIKKTCEKYISDNEKVKYSTDVYLNKDSYEACCAAVGCVLTGIDNIINGKNKKIFCNIRAPGHHATKNEASGFCIFNNIIIGAEYYLKFKPDAKILIIDWDVHHGNGTQSFISNNPNLYYISFHQSPLYPFSGDFSKPSKHIYNYPVDSYINRKEYLEKFITETKYIFDICNPDLIMISCGFDAAIDDPLGSINLYPEDFSIMTKHICTLINTTSGNLISILEGGYHLESLSKCASAHFLSLHNN